MLNAEGHNQPAGRSRARIRLIQVGNNVNRGRTLRHAMRTQPRDVRFDAPLGPVHLRRLSSDCYQLLEKLNGKMADYATYELLLEAEYHLL